VIEANGALDPDFRLNPKSIGTECFMSVLPGTMVLAALIRLSVAGPADAQQLRKIRIGYPSLSFKRL